MNIVGISGLEGAAAFKRAVWTNLREREYRICQGQDSAAALVVNGTPVAAAAEERFDRHKHSAHFPTNALSFCLAQQGLSLSDVDELVHGFDYEPYRQAFSINPHSRRLYNDVYSHEALLALVRRDYPKFPVERVRWVSHHLAHAASAYYTSGWDECLIVVMDGMGEVDGMSVYLGQGTHLKHVASILAQDSIGILYSLVTLHLGFEFNSDEYKIMGLAPYGDPARFRGVFHNLVFLAPDGRIQIPLLQMNSSRPGRETYAESRVQLRQLLGPEREPDEPIDSIHCDIAAALQECLDQTVQHVCGRFGESTGMKRLALAGGVALNCTSNGRLQATGLFEDVFVQPAAGDDGTALGAALYRAAIAGEVRNVRMPVPLLGPEYSRDTILHAFSAFDERLQVHECPNLRATCAEAAEQIAQGKVIGWYRGRMEYGPRALGNRSILADPSIPDMRDRINAMVKMREAFRPFAPAVTLEQAHRWFEVAPLAEFPYMITTAQVRPQVRGELPAVTHVNGSARVQTVSGLDNPAFHTLLGSIGLTTGRELVLNTSFNVKGQPIVNTPAEAIQTFLATNIDALFLEDFLVTRRSARKNIDRRELEALSRTTREATP